MLLRINKNRVLKVLVIAIFVICLIFCSFFATVDTSHAIVTESITTYLVVSTLLVGCGVIASSSDGLNALVNDFTNSTFFKAVASAFNAVVTAQNMLFHPSTDMLDAVKNWLHSKNIKNDTFTVGGSSVTFQGITVYAPYYTSEAELKSAGKVRISFEDIMFFHNAEFYARFDGALRKFNIRVTKSPFIYSEGFSYGFDCYLIDSSGIERCQQGSILGEVCANPEVFSEKYFGFCPSSRYEDCVTVYPFELEIPLNYQGKEVNYTSLPLQNVKTHSTYFPQSGVNGKEMTTSIPLQIPSNTGTLVDAPPESVRVGSNTNTDTATSVGWLEKIWTGVTGIPAAISTALTSFFDISKFDLDFSGFKLGLTKIFPFCIPFDFVRAIKTIAVKSNGLSIPIKLNTPYFKVNHTIDLTPFKIPIMFFRYICNFWFAYILISRTRDWIKW